MLCSGVLISRARVRSNIDSYLPCSLKKRTRLPTTCKLFHCCLNVSWLRGQVSGQLLAFIFRLCVNIIPWLISWWLTSKGNPAILYYDWALTFGLEISSIWKRPVKASAILFLINRYFSIVGNVFVTILNLKTLPPQVCSKPCLNHVSPHLDFRGAKAQFRLSH